MENPQVLYCIVKSAVEAELEMVCKYLLGGQQGNQLGQQNQQADPSLRQYQLSHSSLIEEAPYRQTICNIDSNITNNTKMSMLYRCDNKFGVKISACKL